MSTLKKQAENFLEVNDPYSGELINSLPFTLIKDIFTILENAKSAAENMAQLTRYQRSDALKRVADLVKQNSGELAVIISRESGKPISQAKKEVKRCINTFNLSAAAANKLAGEIIPFDSYDENSDRFGYYTEEPLGIILAITPFNDPLNLVAHKLGPAIAAGNSVILKPSEKTPLSAMKLLEFISETDLPKYAVQAILGDRTLVKPLLDSIDVRMVSFTGGVVSGEAISRRAGLKRLSMDLGGNAANIVCEDFDIKQAVEMCISGAFWANGQNCISVQRILVGQDIYHQFVEVFVESVNAIKTGNPLEEDTFIGPLIDSFQVDRLYELIDDAKDKGAVVHCGASNDKNVFAPTVISDIETDARLWLEECFGPIVCIKPFDSIDQAIELANQPLFSLHAAIFTNDLRLSRKACNKLEAGSVIVNDSSDFRFDGMPFGGGKYGSMGREGVDFAIQEMTQTKTVCFKN